MNTAFLYIKPHAATDKVKALVERELKSSGLSIVSEGTMQTNDIKVNPRIVHFNVEVMRPDSQIFYYVVQWSETNMSWNTVRSLIGETSAQGIRGKIRSTWRELLLEAEPQGVNDSLYFSDSALSGLADRMEWLGARIEDDPTGSEINSAGRELLDEARFWVRNVSVGGKPALVLCRGFNTSELIAALRQNVQQPRRPLEPTSIGNAPPVVPPVANDVFVDNDFRQTEASWMRLKDALRSNPSALVPQCPCAEQMTPGDGINTSVVAAFSSLARHNRENIDRLFVTKTVRSDGHYVVRLFRETAWHDISLDECVPVSGGHVMYMDSRRGQWWPPLLYKALAKAWGSYRLLQAATYPDLMHALTGKPSFVQHIHPRTASDGSTVAPGTAYCGDPTTNNFWARVGNEVIKQHAIVTGRVNAAEGPKYGLSDGASLVLAAAVKIDDALIFKVYRPQHTYKGPYGPGSRELSDKSTQEKLQYEADEAGNFFYVPQVALEEICEYLVVTQMSVDDPVVVSGPWETKMGLPGSTLFRRGAAVNVTNKVKDEVKVTVLIKETSVNPDVSVNASVVSEAAVGFCVVGSRSGSQVPSMLTANAISLRDASSLCMGMSSYPIVIEPNETVALIPVCDPIRSGNFIFLLYGTDGCANSLAIANHPELSRYAIDWDATTKANTDPQRLMCVHALTPAKLDILLKRRQATGTRDVDTAGFARLILYQANSDDVVVQMDRAFALAEVAVSTDVDKGSYDVAVQYAAESSAPLKQETVRVSVFSNDEAEVIVSECRDVEVERLSDARIREQRTRQKSLSVADAPVVTRKRTSLFIVEGAKEESLAQIEAEL